jgi:hypothetical protein
MKCKNCNTEIGSNMSFCPECGTKIEKDIICSVCGTELFENVRFCPECGTEVGENILDNDMMGSDINSEDSSSFTNQNEDIKDVDNNIVEEGVVEDDIVEDIVENEIVEDNVVENVAENDAIVDNVPPGSRSHKKSHKKKSHKKWIWIFAVIIVISLSSYVSWLWLVNKINEETSDILFEEPKTESTEELQSISVLEKSNEINKTLYDFIYEYLKNDECDDLSDEQLNELINKSAKFLIDIGEMKPESLSWSYDNKEFEDINRPGIHVARSIVTAAYYLMEDNTPTLKEYHEFLNDESTSEPAQPTPAPDKSNETDMKQEKNDINTLTNKENDILTNKKKAIDEIIKHDSTILWFVKFYDSDKLHKISDNKKLKILYETSEEGCPFETLFSIIKDRTGRIIAIIESPCNETGDRVETHTHYFDESGKTFAFESYTGIFGSDCADIVRETATNYYNADFEAVKKEHVITDGDGEKLEEECGDIANTERKGASNLEICLGMFNINLNLIK